MLLLLLLLLPVLCWLWKHFPFFPHLLRVLDEDEAAALARGEDEGVEERSGVGFCDGVDSRLDKLDAEEVLGGAEGEHQAEGGCVEKAANYITINQQQQNYCSKANYPAVAIRAATRETVTAKTRDELAKQIGAVCCFFLFP